MKNVRDEVQKKHGNKPEKILQFGEGNFLRAFADWMIDEANDSGAYEGSIVLCQPIPQGAAMRDMINDQDGVYTLVMRGIEDGEAVEKAKAITSVSRCINACEDYDELMALAGSKDLEVVISNTTEAGIVYREGDQLHDQPPASFPAKVCTFLYERFKVFHGAADKGLLFLPAELIDNNGGELKRIVLQYAEEWGLEADFITWILEANKFTSTLVDRIVTGYPRDQLDYFKEKLGYEDNVLVTSEIFNLWVIEGKKEWADIIPIHKGQPNVIWTDDVTPYKKRKVRILNGGHTATVLAAYLAGHDIVLDFMKDALFRQYLEQLLYKEVIPTIELPEEELKAFASAVSDRFANPYISHKLLDISLNSCSKFKARCLPSLLAYTERHGKLPELLSFSLAAFIQFYKIEKSAAGYTGMRADGTVYQVQDDAEVLSFFENIWKKEAVTEIARNVLGNEALWDQNLCEIAGLEEAVTVHLKALAEKPVPEVVREVVGLSTDQR